MMHYWNRDNFNGLKSVGEKYWAKEGYELFGKYCLQKEQGLKKAAVVSIKKFVSSVKNRTQKEQRVIAEELSALGFWNGDIHQLLAYPLVEFLNEVLKKWISDEPDNPTPYKWLGYVAQDISCYEKALQLDPKDEICINRIAQAHLNDVDHQAHHLSESLFLGEISDARKALQLAQSLIHRLSTEDIKTAMKNELEYYDRLLTCWEEYSSLGAKESFPNWCASKGQQFNFGSVVYYD